MKLIKKWFSDRVVIDIETNTVLEREGEWLDFIAGPYEVDPHCCTAAVIIGTVPASDIIALDKCFTSGVKSPAM